MKNHRSKIVYLLSLLIAAFVWSPLSAADQKGTLIVALESLGGQSMDPIQEGRPTNAHIQAPVFDSLLGYDYEKGGVGPGVAISWVLSDDGLSWTFQLRKDVKWHNGDPLTAHDVKFSLERTMSKDSLSSRRAQLRRNVTKIEVVDDYSVRISTKGVQVHFPSGLSRSVFQEGQLMPKKYIEKVGEEEFRKRPIGSGPWKFVRSVPGDLIEYEAVDYPPLARHAEVQETANPAGARGKHPGLHGPDRRGGDCVDQSGGDPGGQGGQIESDVGTGHDAGYLPVLGPLSTPVQGLTSERRAGARGAVPGHRPAADHRPCDVWSGQLAHALRLLWLQRGH